jgi:hypothetical protein
MFVVGFLDHGPATGEFRSHLFLLFSRFDEPPIGAHCAPARDTSALRSGIIPSLSRANGTDRDEARNLILRLRFNHSVEISRPPLGIYPLSDKKIGDNP